MEERKLVINDKSVGFVIATEKAVDKALAIMAMDIESLAKLKVPVDKGHLQSSIHHGKIKPLNYAVWAGGNGDSTNRRGEVINTSDYALAQEMGTNGIVTFRNYTTAGTGKHYLKESSKKVKEKMLIYIRTQTHNVKM